MANAFDRLQYRLGTSARVGIYSAAYLASQRFAGPEGAPGEPAFKPSYPYPTRQQLSRALASAFEKDWANIAAGVYKKPSDLRPNLPSYARRLTRYFQDLPAVNKRRLEKGHSEVLSEEAREKYPRYYLQNFHYQTDGWLSDDSARVYDTQVEVLFTGAADAMRRQALVPLSRFMRGRDQRTVTLVDVACGTGRFLKSVKENYPRLPVTGLDLSPAYLEQTGRTLDGFSRVDLARANAEAMPFDDNSVDIVTNIYLFHELPPKVRRTVAKEIARVLKPGGLFVLADSLQLDDAPELNALLEAFPVNFHEPYYASYTEEDLEALFGDNGLVLEDKDHAFLTKVVSFRKPEAG